MKLILQERNLYKDQKRNCQGITSVNRDCCAVHLLANQPDFLAQKSLLEEAIVKQGHIFELYPRFHCETNPIERFWGAAKKVARQNCNYSFISLDKNIDSFLDSASPPGEPPLLVRRYWNKSFRYIAAYSEGKDANQALEVVKEFSKAQKSHRKLRLNQ